MQGRERADRTFLDAAGLAGHLVPAGSMFAFLAAHRADVFPGADYADMFAPPGVGRPSVPATQMAAVLALQALHDFSDRETAEAVRFDVRWKVAIGAAVDDPGFDPSTLVYWRRRIAKSARPHRVNDAVKNVIEHTGVLAGRRRRVADSTLLADAVASQDTVTQLVAAVRKVARQVPGAAEAVARVCTGHDYADPKRPSCDWDDPAAREALVSALVNDAHAVVAAVSRPGLDEAAASAVALLALIAGQDVEPAEGSDGTDGRWRIARPKDKGHGTTTADRVISVTDPQARHARKHAHDRTDGYRAHIAAEPETGIITDEELTMAAGPDNSDAAAAARFVAREHPAPPPPDTAGADSGQAGSGQAGTAGAGTAGAGSGQAGSGQAGSGQAGSGQAGSGQAGSGQAGSGQAGSEGPLAWYGDSNYGTGELRQAISDAGDDAVIKPKTLRPPAVPSRFTISDFTPDEDAGTLTCPNGVTRRIPPGRTVTFGAACRTCPLAGRCLPPKSKDGRVVKLHRHDKLLRAARRDWAASKDLRKDYSKTRPHIERAIAQVATQRGRRVKLRYRGTARNHAWLKNRTAALNLRNLIGKGLHRTAGAWALAT